MINYIQVFFYDESKLSSKALEHMEDIDDETDAVVTSGVKKFCIVITETHK